MPIVTSGGHTRSDAELLGTMGTYAGFVDVGYLTAEGAKSLGKKPRMVRINAPNVIKWLHNLSQTQIRRARFLRAYWYDAVFDPQHGEYKKQRGYFDEIAYTPGIQLRLGYLVERRSKLEEPFRAALKTTAEGLGICPDDLVTEFDKHWTFYPERQQKGVDTLITLDMVRLASRSVFNAAVVISGDRDLAEVIRTVQDYGVRVLIVTPNPRSVAREVAQLADDVIELGAEEVKSLLTHSTTQTPDR